MSDRLSKIQRLSLYHMGKRHIDDAQERVTMAALKTHVHENYKPAPSNGNFRTSLRRLVARGYLIEHATGSRGKAQAPSYQLTAAGIDAALKLIAEGNKAGPVRPSFLL